MINMVKTTNNKKRTKEAKKGIGAKKRHISQKRAYYCDRNEKKCEMAQLDNMVKTANIGERLKGQKGKRTV